MNRKMNIKVTDSGDLDVFLYTFINSIENSYILNEKKIVFLSDDYENQWTKA